jgi:ferredoxin
MRIIVNAERCQGHARCQAEGPDIYVLDDLGYNSTSIGEVPPDLQRQARRGAMACPEYAITIADELADRSSSAADI